MGMLQENGDGRKKKNWRLLDFLPGEGFGIFIDVAKFIAMLILGKVYRYVDFDSICSIIGVS